MPAFAWEAASDSGSGVDCYWVKIDNGNWQDVGGVTTYTQTTPLAEGTHQFQVCAMDKAGNSGEITSLEFTTSAPVPTGFATYTDQAKFFSVSYPSEWTLLLSSAVVPVNVHLFERYGPGFAISGSSFIFYAQSPITKGNVNIVVQPLSDMTAKGWTTLDQIAEGKLERQKQLSVGFREISRDSSVVGGNAAVISVWEDSPSDPVPAIRCVQLFLVSHEILFKVTCYIDATLHDANADELLAIVKSLRILK